jgi:hypothetical protein
VILVARRLGFVQRIDQGNVMPDRKNLRWADGLSMEAASKAKQNDNTVSTRQSAANDADGWQQYRQWISKAPAPRGRRVGIDPSLYSWKGYRNWTEQIRRNWSPENGDDSE